MLERVSLDAIDYILSIQIDHWVQLLLIHILNIKLLISRCFIAINSDHFSVRPRAMEPLCSTLFLDNSDLPIFRKRYDTYICYRLLHVSGTTSIVIGIVNNDVEFSRSVLLDLTINGFLNPRRLISTFRLLLLLARFELFYWVILLKFWSLCFLSDRLYLRRRFKELVAPSFVAPGFLDLPFTHISGSISRRTFQRRYVLGRPIAWNRQIWRWNDASEIVVIEIASFVMTINWFVHLDQYMVIKALIRRIIPISLIRIYWFNHLIFKHEDFSVFESWGCLYRCLLTFNHPIWEKWWICWKSSRCGQTRWVGDSWSNGSRKVSFRKIHQRWRGWWSTLHVVNSRLKLIISWLRSFWPHSFL